MSVILTALKVSAGLFVVGIAAALQTGILILLLPSRSARIRSCIIFERIVGVTCLWLTGCEISVEGSQHLDAGRPAIYIFNHTSMLDFFIGLRLIPYGSVGIVKKQIVWYPFVGQVVMLSGHLRIDRADHEAAVGSLKALGDLVGKARLSIVMAPEGTRSKDGRLQPFKKGLAHLAVATRLPVVPIVVHGAHKAWTKGSLDLRGAAVKVQVLPAVDTSSWLAERAGEAMEEMHAIYMRSLPQDQLPI